jgi:hypothetical protein
MLDAKTAAIKETMGIERRTGDSSALLVVRDLGSLAAWPRMRPRYFVVAAVTVAYKRQPSSVKPNSRCTR